MYNPTYGRTANGSTIPDPAMAIPAEGGLTTSHLESNEWGLLVRTEEGHRHRQMSWVHTHMYA